MCHAKVGESTKESLAWRQNGKAMCVNKVGDFHLHRLVEAHAHFSVSWKFLNMEFRHIVPPFGPSLVHLSAQYSSGMKQCRGQHGCGNILDPDVGIFISPFGFFCTARNTDNFRLYRKRLFPYDKIIRP